MTLWNRIEQLFKHKWLYLFEKLWGRSVLDPREIDVQNIQRILVLRQHDQLGDFLLSTPVFRALAKHFPQAHLCLVANKHTANLMKHQTWLDEVLVFHKDGHDWSWKQVKHFWKQLRQGWDLTVVLNTVSHSLTTDMLAFLSKAPLVLGPEHHRFKGTTRNFFYNLISPVDEVPKSQSERNLDIVRYIGVTPDSAHQEITLTASELENSRHFLEKKGNDQSPLLVVHPGAGKIGNRWPVEYFAQVCDRLASEYDMQIFVTWGPDEQDLGKALLTLLKTEAMDGVFGDLRELAALFAHATLVLCNDTGVMHLASAVHAPLVAVFGPTDPTEWKPVGEPFIAVRSDDHLTPSVTPERVFMAAMTLFDRLKDKKKSTF